MERLPQTIRVVLADAFECVRASVAGYLDGQGDLALVGAVSTLADAVTLVQHERVDCLIAELEDLDYPPMLLLALLAQHAPDTGVIFHSGTTTRVGDLLRAGAHGYVHKRDPLELVGTAIRTVQAGQMYVSPHAQAVLTPRDRLVYEYQLTQRDLAVLRLLVKGTTLRGIAQELQTSESDITSSIGHLLRRTNTETRVQLASWYRHHVHGSSGGDSHQGALIDDLHEALSHREVDVLQLVHQGYTNQQIAEELGIVSGTAKFHVKNILDKLGAPNRREAVQVARQRGLL